jgi:hypothetical protein
MIIYKSSSSFACGPALASTCTYLEMAKKNWSGEATDPGDEWCSNKTTSGATKTAIGEGAANMATMLATTPTFTACSTSAANAILTFAALDLSMGGKSDWYLPSRDELNAMCNFVRTWVGTPSAPPTGACSGTSTTYAAGDYGFDPGWYWSSSEISIDRAAVTRIDNAATNLGVKDNSGVQVRPIRAF